MNVSSLILAINRRLTRSNPLNVNSWIILMENLEIFGLFDEISQVWRKKFPKFFEASHENFLALQSAHLDCLRRQQGKDEELLSTFQTAIQDEEQVFGIEPARSFSSILRASFVRTWRN